MISALVAALCGLFVAKPDVAPSVVDSSVIDSSAVAFVDVSVVPMDRERVLERQTVVVRAGRIAAMGPVGKTAVPSDAVRIDGRGKFLMPGLVDMHAHLVSGAGEMTDGAGQQLALYLATGVTTVRGLGVLGASPPMLTLRDRIARGELPGPTLYVASPSLNGRSVPDAATGRRKVEEAKRAGYDLLKTHGGVTRAVYDTIVAAAKDVGLRLVGHVTPGYGLRRALEVGQQVEHLDGYLAELLPPGTPAPDGQIFVDPALLSQMDERRIPELAQATVRAGVWNGPTLALFAMIVSDSTPEQLAARPEMRYVPRQALRQWVDWRTQVMTDPGPAEGRRRFVELRNQLVRALHDSGAKLLAGSDSPQFFMAPGYSLHRELAAFVGAGLTPYAALETATRNPAEWLGRANDVGTVAPGKVADLILLDANPLADVGNARKLAGVMVRGRWLPRAALDATLERVAAAVKE